MVIRRTDDRRSRDRRTAMFECFETGGSAVQFYLLVKETIFETSFIGHVVSGTSGRNYILFVCHCMHWFLILVVVWTMCPCHFALGDLVQQTCCHK